MLGGEQAARSRRQQQPEVGDDDEGEEEESSDDDDIPPAELERFNQLGTVTSKLRRTSPPSSSSSSPPLESFVLPVSVLSNHLLPCDGRACVLDQAVTS